MFERNGLTQSDRRAATDGDAAVGTQGNGLRLRTLSDVRRHVHDGIGAQTDAPLAKG